MLEQGNEAASGKVLLISFHRLVAFKQLLYRLFGFTLHSTEHRGTKEFAA